MEASGRPVVLLKLGGSLITDKERPATARAGVIHRLAGEIAAVLPDLEASLVVGHGSGSFGHAAAARHGLGRDAPIPATRAGVVETRASVEALHHVVAASLRDAGVPVLSFSPSSAAVASAGRLVSLSAEPLARALELELVPLLCGDVAMDRELGATILSTEMVLEAVTEALEGGGWRATGVVWLGATDGVYDARGVTIPLVRPDAPEEAALAAGGSAATDVTGGMAHRLETALRLARRGVPSWIGDGRRPGILARALRGEANSGTRVVPRGDADASPAPDAGPER